MSNENGTPSMEEIIGGLKSLQGEFQLRLDAAEAEVEKIKNEKRSVDQMLAAAERTGKYQSRGTYKGKRRALSAELTEEFYETMKKSPGVSDDLPGTFTVKSIATDTGRAESATRTAFDRLRTQGRIRLVGERILGGTRASKIYALSD